MFYSAEPKSDYIVGQNVKVIDGEFKGQTFTIKYVNIASVTLVRDASKSSSFYNTLTLPKIKIAHIWGDV